ncbi:O-antigen ligase family protein [Rickettsiales endosymbiont of Peranema trichophorum]|uniref:O-antigen ligase family protein n=1 Tax=Rickettsiales endosymbiont of Peranema trichophorum TaxID=2486577 RepID=UPI001022F9F1|nr:O-antigen ligase family protein [Rickettsiales endosymbiont of Peranema trichophorum]RZI46341.1 O-antigen ligase family protein [Rickettsiales endosymbiont of Peranema trichophorum]
MIPLCFLLLPIAGVLGALSLSVFFVFVICGALYTRDLKLLDYRVHILFLCSVVLLFCCFSYITPYTSVVDYARVVAIAYLGFLLASSTISNGLALLQSEKIIRYFEIGFIITLICCFIEQHCGGMVIRLFHEIFSTRVEKSLYLRTDLNRGMTFLSMLVWVMVYRYYCRRAFVKIGLVLASTLYVIMYSESEAAKVALLCSTSIVLFSSIFLRRFHYLFFICFVSLSCLTPFIIMSIIENPQCDFLWSRLPQSWQHRLYIWTDVLNLISIKPYFGWGFGSSRIFAKLGDILILPASNTMGLFSSHPHNAVLQVLLEVGIVGSITYTVMFAYIMNKIRLVFPIDAQPFVYGILSAYILVSQCSYNIWAAWWLSAPFIAVYSLRMAVMAKDREQSA